MERMLSSNSIPNSAVSGVGFERIQDFRGIDLSDVRVVVSKFIFSHILNYQFATVLIVGPHTNFYHVNIFNNTHTGKRGRRRHRCRVGGRRQSAQIGHQRNAQDHAKRIGAGGRRDRSGGMLRNLAFN